jgi:hypothetical protein
MWQRYKPIILIAVVVGAVYGIHMLVRYMKIRADSERRAAIVVHPKEDEESVSEIGYIYSMRDEVFLNENNTVNLVWFIKVPASGNRYSCPYESGFPEFKVGDDVRIVRPKDPSGYGYIIGLHYKISGKAALVWVIDEDELEMDIDDPEGPQE